MQEGVRPAETPVPNRALSRPVRIGLQVVGLVCVALGGLGVLLPGLPTTPFLLIAAAAFARSSPSLHRRLLDNRVFGPLIRDWQVNRTISPGAKLSAVASIAVLGGATLVFLVPRPAGRIGLGAIMLTVVIWLVTRPSTPRNRP